MFNTKLNFITLLLLFSANNFTYAQPQLWGTTSSGGSTLGGTIFKLDTAGNNYSLIYDWDNLNNGKKPLAGLLQASNEKLYGVTFQDGPLFGGVLYEYDYITDTYTRKHDFTDATGSLPEGQVIQAANGKLYGLAGFGGAFSFGVLYEYDLTTDTYTNLVDFDGPILGSGPHGKLTEAPNGKLYGINSHGGANGFGTLFEYDISTSTAITKIDLDSINSGFHPYGGLTLASNGKMYALSNFGGTLDMGILFEYDYVTNTVVKHVDFLGPNGAFPYNDLIQATNGKLYGLTFEGGAFNAGTLFEFDISTNTLTVIFDFDGGVNGSNPKGALMQSSNGKIYGYNNFGGVLNKGVVFEYDIATNTVTTKLDFNGVNGIYNDQNYFIEICAKPTINIASIPNDTLCNGETLTLNASGTGAAYNWDNSITNGATFTPPLGLTTYTVSSTNGCGTSSLPVDILVNPTYNTNIYDSLCSGDSYTFPDNTTQSNITVSLIDTSSLVTISGCDSNVIVHLFAKPNYFINTTDAVCSGDSYIFPDGYTENNITVNVSHTSNLQTTLFCDSIITTSVFVNSIYLIKDSIYVCTGDSYTFPDGFIENNITAEVIHSSILASIFGCDSTILTTVTPNPTYNISETVQICSGDTYIYPDGFTENNILVATSHISNVFTNEGCDSIVTTNIIVNPIFTIEDNISLCSGSDYTFPDGLTIPNIVNDTTHISALSSANACDTLVTTNITINPNYYLAEYDTICYGESYTYPDGFTENNIATNTSHINNLFSIFGCDSIITTSINVTTLYATVTEIGSSQLIANASPANYQWLDCNTNTPINGATDQAFVPDETGSYGVIVSNNYCIDTSICYDITVIGIGIEESIVNPQFNIYPNPTNDFVTIDFKNSVKNGEIVIYSLNGQLLKSYKNINKSQIKLDLTDLQKGLYIIKIKTLYATNFVRIIKT